MGCDQAVFTTSLSFFWLLHLNTTSHLPSTKMPGIFISFAALLLCHKLLNCHIETDQENKVWYVIDKKLSPEVNTPDSKNINKILINELKHRFDFEKGPLIRFTLLNQTETTLIINCHHAICDGMSLVYLFNDISRYSL